MAYDFKKLTDAELLDEVPENANAFVEVGGDIKRVPGTGLGGSGGGGVQVAIFKKNKTTYAVTCDNMTYEDAKALVPSAQLFVVFAKVLADSDPITSYEILREVSFSAELDRITVSEEGSGTGIYIWKASGISYDPLIT